MKDKDVLQEISTALWVTQRRQNQDPEADSTGGGLHFVSRSWRDNNFPGFIRYFSSYSGLLRADKNWHVTLLAQVPNPNIGSGSYSSHELITAAASLWLPTAFCLQGCLQSLLSGTKDSQFTSARLFQAWPEAYPPDVPRHPETTAT